MLQARDSDDFLPLSVELYGGVSPSLRRQAEGLLASITTTEPSGDALDAEEFLALAEEEIAHYRDERPRPRHACRDPGRRQRRAWSPATSCSSAPRPRCSRHAPRRCSTTRSAPTSSPRPTAATSRSRCMGVGLAGYDETQEGLAVLAEIACGGLTAFRLRQLASRVVTVHRMIGGASFAEAHEALVDDDFPVGERVHDRHARLSLRRHDQGRHLPPRPRRAPRAPRRRRSARPAAGSASSPCGPAADRRPRRTAGCSRPASGPAALPARPGDPRQPGPMRSGPRTSAPLLEGHS